MTQSLSDRLGKFSADLLQSTKGNIGNRKIAFFHIPKCGGTSVIRSLRLSLGPKAMLSRKAYWRLAAHQSTISAGLLGQDLTAHREQIIAYQFAQPETRFIAGHVEFSNRIHEKFGHEWDMLTILREPIARWKSNYLYNRHKANREHFATELDIDAYLNTPDADHHGCTLVRYMMGSDEPNPARSTAGVKRAKENFDKFAVVGLVEDMADFEQRLSARFGVQYNFTHENKSPAPKSEKPQIPQSAMSQIETLCAPDLELYHYVKDRLQQG